jgi:uncharacterized protein DUF6875
VAAWLTIFGGCSMSAKSTNLFLLQDLEGSSRTKELEDTDLHALHQVADWIKTFVARPHDDLGRAGPVCPFVPEAWERKTLWLAPEHVANHGVAYLVQLVNGYKRLLLSAGPTAGDDANYKAIVVVFTDLSADRAKDYLDDVQIQQLKPEWYVDDGVVLGAFHERNGGLQFTTRASIHSKEPCRSCS